MSKSNRILVRPSTTTVTNFSCTYNNYLFNYDNIRVNWSELYDADHYEKQEQIYKTLRPTLLSNTLIVPTQKIREHIYHLTANNYFGIQQQVTAYRQTVPVSLGRNNWVAFIVIELSVYSDQQSIVPTISAFHHLQTYTIEINAVENNQMDAQYLLIDGKILRTK